MFGRPDQFDSWRSYGRFASSVRTELRYLHTAETQRFLEAVRLTSESRRSSVPEGQVYWRAQEGHDFTQVDDILSDVMPSPFPPSRMKPQNDRASDGRANPRGIPYLYMADEQITAISEIRPWIGSLVSVGRFVTKRALQLVDCSMSSKLKPHFSDELPPEERELAVWARIDAAFSQPMTRTDDYADYVPTQVLAELFKRAGADGLLYRSNFGGGRNLVLFNPQDADMNWCGLFQVDAVDIRARDPGPSYDQYTVYPGDA